MKHAIRTTLAALLLAGTAAAHAADAFPSRPLRLVVPFAPGGTTDMVARTLAAGLEQKLGQSVVVDNKGGGATIIGTETLAKAAPDGYTIMLATPDLTINPSLQPKLPYDTKKDIAPIALIATYPMVLVANAEHKIGSVADLVAKARAKPGTINFASAGNGSMPHLCAELLNSLAGVKLTHVPYKGNGPAIQDLLAGRVSLLFSGGPPIAAHVKAGKLQVLGVSTLKRHPTLPEVPTVAESGVNNYDVTAWFGFIAPAGVPKDVVAKLNTAVAETLQDPAVRSKLAVLGADLGASSPEAFGSVIDSELEKWAKVVKAAEIKLQ